MGSNPYEGHEEKFLPASGKSPDPIEVDKILKRLQKEKEKREEGDRRLMKSAKDWVTEGVMFNCGCTSDPQGCEPCAIKAVERIREEAAKVAEEIPDGWHPAGVGEKFPTWDGVAIARVLREGTQNDA